MKSTIPRDWLGGLKDHWKTDLMSGLIIFLIALPLSLGIALASGAPAASGLIAAIIGGIIGSLTSGSFVTINGPAAGLIAVNIGAIHAMSGANADPILGFKNLLGCLVIVGILQVVTGLFKGGNLAFLVPSSVVHGMLASIGVIIMSKQVHVMLGVSPHSTSILGMIAEIPSSLGHRNDPVAIVGLSSLLILMIWNRIPVSYSKKLPGPLMVVILGIVLSRYFHFSEDHYIEMWGEKFEVGKKFLVNIPENVSLLLTSPDFSQILTKGGIISLITIFFVCTIESVLSCSAVDKLDVYQRKSDFNKDLIGKGVANLFCGILGGIPIISEIVRSSANVSNGAKTRWSNFFHGWFILIFLVFLPFAVKMIPLSALAGILVMVGFRLAHPKQLVEVYHHGVDQLALFVLTLIVTLATDLLLGILAGIVLELIFLFMRGLSIRDLFRIGHEIVSVDGKKVVRLYGSMVFFNLLDQRKKLYADGTNICVYDLRDLKVIDYSSLEMFNDHIRGLIEDKKEVEIWLSGEENSSQTRMKHSFQSFLNIIKIK